MDDIEALREQLEDAFPREAIDLFALLRVLTDAERYRWLRDAPRADVRIVGRGKREGAELDATLDELLAG